MMSSILVGRKLFFVCWIALLGCQAKQPTVEKTAIVKAIQIADWYGVYASLEEYGGIEGQVLVLSDKSPLFENGGGGFRLKSWTDFGVSDGVEENIRLSEVSGEFLTSGNQVYIPVPRGRTKDGKVTSLSAAINRYTRVTINQEVVLLADHALEQHQKGESLKTTGILIKLPVANDDYAGFDIASLKSLPSEKLILSE